MQEFIDLPGGSQTKYRFRLLPQGAYAPRTGGNLAIVRRNGERLSVVHLLATNDLAKAVEELPVMPGKGPFFRYIRLNVARLTREAEHEDLMVVHGELALVD